MGNSSKHHIWPSIVIFTVKCPIPFEADPFAHKVILGVYHHMTMSQKQSPTYLVSVLSLKGKFYEPHFTGDDDRAQAL